MHSESSGGNGVEWGMVSTGIRLIVALLVVLATTTAGFAEAAAGERWGSLDNSFGRDGRVVSELPPAFLVGTFTHIAESPGGELIASIHQRSGRFVESPDRFAIERRLADGSLDPSFGVNGSVEVPGAVTALALDSGGGVLYAIAAVIDPGSGEYSFDGTVHRLNRDGSADAGFAGRIPYEAEAPTDEAVVEQIAVASDGTIVVGASFTLSSGKGAESTFGNVLTRLLPSGSPDPAFNGGVAIIFPDPLGRGYTGGDFRDLSVLADGSVLTLSWAGGDTGVRRFRSDGSPDASFGVGGVLVDPKLSAGAMIVDAAGRIVLAGTQGGSLANVPPSYLFRRFSAAGVPDTSFGLGGATTVTFGDGAVPVEFAVGPDGGVVLLGNSAGEGMALGQAPVLVRLDAAGTPVPGFGSGGALAVEPARPPLELDREAAQGKALVISPEGRIVVAGTSGDAMLVARAYGGGPEPAFGGGQSSLLQIGTRPSTTEARGLVVEPDGELLVAVVTNAYRRDPRPGLLPFAADGSPAAAAAEPLRYLPASVGGQIFADGRRKLIVLTGHRGLARIDLQGRLDPSFGEGGIVKPPRYFNAYDVVVSRDHGLFLIGGVEEWGLVVARYDPRGRLDRDYGQRGVARVADPGFYAKAQAAVALPGGKLLIAGTSGQDLPRLTLARLRSNGKLDRSFGDHGRVRRRVGSTSSATLVGRQGSNLLVAGVRHSLHGFSGQAFLLRFHADGSFDRTFGNHGYANASGMGKPVAILPSRRGPVLVGDPRSGGVLLRAFHRDGSIDRRFGNGGSTRAAANRRRPRYYPRTAVRVPGGRIVVAGTIGIGNLEGNRVELLRFR